MSSTFDIELGLTLASGAIGAFLLLLTSGTAGGFLVQPRVIKGVPTGPNPNPGNGNGGNGNGDGGGGNGGEGNGGGDGNGNGGGEGGGQGGGEGGGQGPNQGQEVPICLWDSPISGIVQEKLAEYASEAEPYATARVPLPWTDVNSGTFNLLNPAVQEGIDGPGSGIPVGSWGYYLTGVMVHTLLQTGRDPNQFAQGSIFFPGCAIPAGAFVGDTPLRRLYTAWEAGGGILPPEDA